MKFDEFNIDEGIKKSLAKHGFIRPTDIQFKSIPAILQGNDVLAIAQTGTGKTAAFVLPVLHMLQIRKQKGRGNAVKCLVMAPTHELAKQTELVFKKIGKHTRINTFCIHGGTEQDTQIAKLREGVDILIATPGRMFDLVSQQELDLSEVQILVVDEADHMLDKGFIKDIRDMVRFIPRRRQTLFFSATITPEIKKLAYELVNDAIHIRISPKDPVGKNIDHSVAYVEMDDKRFFLEELIKTNEEAKILVFVRTKIRAERVKSAMERVGIATETIHSDKEQQDRNRTMHNFRTGANRVLIATDISARGIDIPNVEYVVNYDLPEVAENYVHRVGRTGRAGKRGQAYSFCSSEEQPLLKAIEEYTGNKIKQLEITKKDYKQVIQESNEDETDWQSLLNEENARQDKKRRKK